MVRRGATPTEGTHRWPARRWASVAVAGGSVAALAALGARTAARRTDHSPVRAQTRVDRTTQIARMGTALGARFALRRAQRLFLSAERRIEFDERHQLRTAEHVAAALGNMKGALMKVGQMASYLDAGLPDHVRDALKGLQHDAPPMSAELAAGVVERELGEPPDRVFLRWDPVPIASASIGQVHRAITRDERAVAVKVQYPGVDAAIRADLDNAGLLLGVLGMVFDGLDTGPLVEELRTRITEEVDYEHEATNQRFFADAYRGHPFIHIPEVIDELSTVRVLTTELATGSRFDDLLKWNPDERNQAAETIYRFVFRSLNRLRAFNGDPHPGNYLFRPGGEVTFLDFGLVKHFTVDEMSVMHDMIRAMVFENNPARYRSIVEGIGMLRPGEPFTDQQVEDYFGHFYEFVMDDREVTITPEWSTETVSRFFDPGGPYGPVLKAANLPPSFVILQRINLGLMSILGHLGARANFRRIAEELWPWVDGPASTALGREEAKWLAARARDAAPI